MCPSCVPWHVWFGRIQLHATIEMCRFWSSPPFFSRVGQSHLVRWVRLVAHDAMLQRARDLHRAVPADRWCITRSEFQNFVKEVHRLWESGLIPCSEPNQTNSLHWNPLHGPNLHDVNSHVVKPMTLKAGGASYALMKHPEGLECEVFVSHSWRGGIFHLRRGIQVAWPQLYQRRNLYCCLLSNPQNLDLDEFIGGNLAEVRSL